MASLYERLKDSPLIHWPLLYLAGAWLVWQVLDTFGPRWGLDDSVQRGIDVVLVAGVAVVAVLAWFRGVKGNTRVSGPEFVMIALLLGIAGLGVSLTSGIGGDPQNADAIAEVAPPPSAFEGEPGLAVLPFENRSDVADNQYLTDGIHDELQTALSRLPGLKLVSSTSAAAYRQSGQTAPEIAEGLDIEYLLEGSVQRAGDEVLVNVRLIDAREDRQLWAESYEADFTVSGIFEVQSQIVEALNAQLSLQLNREEWERDARKRTDNDRAFDNYLRTLSMGGADDEERQIELLTEATTLDPSFLSAWARLSAVHAAAYQLRGDVSPERREAAFDAARRALEIDSTAVEAQFAMGMYLYRVESDWEGSMEWFERASGRLHSDFQYYVMRGTIERRAGRFEAAIRSLETALELNPLESFQRLILMQPYMFLGRFDHADRHAREIERLTPGAMDGRMEYSDYELHRHGEPGEQTAMYMEEVQAPWLLVEFGRWEELAEMAPLIENDAISDQVEWSPKELYLARALEQLGRRDEARAAYERAAERYEERMAESPGDARLQSGAAFAFAKLGRSERAMQAADSTFALQPEEFDWIERSWFMLQHAETLLTVGFEDQAVETLDRLFSQPRAFTIRRLENHQRFVALHDHPGFQEILNRYRLVMPGEESRN